MDDDDFVPPPPRPPPLLAPESLHHLCTHGYLGLALPRHLADRYDRLLAAADAFFAEPLDAKLPYRPGVGRLGPPTSAANTERGYTHLAGEKEYLTLRKSLTHLPPGPLGEAAAAVWHDTAHLLHRILGDVGVYLGLGPTAWDGVVADSLRPGDEGGAHHPRDDPPTLLRLFRYEPGGGGAEQHRDLGLLTLCVCWGPGLQVRPQPPAGEAAGGEQPWLDAPRVTVMTGDTLHVLSTNRVPSAVHRVVVAPEGAAGAEGRASAAPSADARLGDEEAGPGAPSADVPGEGKAEADAPSGERKEAGEADAAPSASRRSIVFALRATTAGDIDLSAFGGYGSVGARELYDRIRRQRVNINANKESREAMRTEYRKGRGKEGRGDEEDEGGNGKGKEKEGENEGGNDGDGVQGDLVGVA